MIPIYFHLHTELLIAKSYLNRLFLAIEQSDSKNKSQNIFQFLEILKLELVIFFNAESEIEKPWTEIDLQNCHSYIERMLMLPFYTKKNALLAINYINKIFSASHEIHNQLLPFKNLNITLPQTLIATKIIQEHIPIFQIENNFLIDFKFDKFDNEIFFIEKVRESKFQELISEGKNQLAIKNYQKAIDIFSQARKFNNNEEILTLLAWSNSLNNNQQEALKNCELALKLNPHYGPALNELGCILLKQKNYINSLIFFNKAKKGTYLENREYPFVNAGKAHFALNNFNEALKEFSMAKIISPDNSELDKIITQLREKLDYQDQITQ